MAIYISNSIYLNDLITNPNAPIIGWKSCFTLGGVIVSETNSAPGYSPAAVWSPDTYSCWKSLVYPLVETFQKVVLQNSTGMAIDYVGIAGHNMFETGIPYAIDGGTDLSTWTEITPYRYPVSDAPAMEFLDPIYYPFYRVRFRIPAGLQISVAHIKIGKATVLQRPRYVGDIPGGMNVKTETIGSKSYAGQHLGSILISQGDSFSIVQENNTPEFVRSSELQNFFKHAHELKKLSNGPVETFFFAWRPLDYPLEVQYCGETTKFDAPSNTRSNGMMSWSMSGDAFK